MEPSQCRAARGLLEWTQDDLANAAQVSVVSVRQFEKRSVVPHRATLASLRRALEAAGIVFIEQNGGGPGVRLRDRQPRSKKD